MKKNKQKQQEKKRLTWREYIADPTWADEENSENGQHSKRPRGYMLGYLFGLPLFSAITRQIKRTTDTSGLVAIAVVAVVVIIGTAMAYGAIPPLITGGPFDVMLGRS